MCNTPTTGHLLKCTTCCKFRFTLERLPAPERESGLNSLLCIVIYENAIRFNYVRADRKQRTNFCTATSGAASACWMRWAWPNGCSCPTRPMWVHSSFLYIVFSLLWEKQIPTPTTRPCFDVFQLNVMKTRTVRERIRHPQTNKYKPTS